MEIATTPVHTSLFSGPGAWTSDEFKRSPEFIYHFRPETLAEIDDAVRLRRDKVNDFAPGDPWRPPSFEADAAKLGDELRTGRGFVVLRGLPLDKYSESEA